jgi:hypothetical protein
MTTVVSYGGGTNSTAILVGMHERGLRPDLTMFADTGNELPHTYAHLDVMQTWCASVGFPPITVIKNGLPQGVIDGSLYGECVRLGTLPSKVFGRSGCSQKWKLDPQYLYLKKWMADRGISHVAHVVGFDADELNRATKRTPSREFEVERYLLIEWDWGREECKAAIARAGLPQPGKSACFMCPSSKKPEVLLLKENHPDLYLKAIVMERRAIRGEGQAPIARVDGLGRHWNWATFAGSDVATPEVDCGCYDGGSE